MGRLDAALAGFFHPAAERELKWDLARAGWIRGFLHYVSDPERRKLVERHFTLYEGEVVPLLALRRASFTTTPTTTTCWWACRAGSRARW